MIFFWQYNRQAVCGSSQNKDDCATNPDEEKGCRPLAPCNKESHNIGIRIIRTIVKRLVNLTETSPNKSNCSASRIQT